MTSVNGRLLGATCTREQISNTKEHSTSEAYRSLLIGYRTPNLGRSVWQLLTTIIPFAGCWALAYFSTRYSYWITLGLAVPTAGLLVRIFIIQHDCGHRSFFRSAWLCDVVGTALSVVTMTPYYAWRRRHAVHHATSGDLDRQGMGDIKVLTVKEYAALPWLKRMSYRIYRNPIVLFVIAPIFYFTVEQRLTYDLPRSWKKERFSVHWTNCMVAASIVLMCWLLGAKAFFVVHLPVTIVASSVGVWLFYVQHNFEQTYWQRKKSWNYWDAAFEGSSYYHLPKVLQWFTASIGLHHIHHLDSRIPNYHLQKCLDENPEMLWPNRVTLLNSLKCIPLRLWDEDRQQMVGFSAARKLSSGTLRASTRAPSGLPGDPPANLEQVKQNSSLETWQI